MHAMPVLAGSKEEQAVAAVKEAFMEGLENVMIIMAMAGQSPTVRGQYNRVVPEVKRLAQIGLFSFNHSTTQLLNYSTTQLFNHSIAYPKPSDPGTGPWH